jgi:hypothetical protein
MAGAGEVDLKADEDGLRPPPNERHLEVLQPGWMLRPR